MVLANGSASSTVTTIRQSIVRIFTHRHGLTLTSDAASHLADRIGNPDHARLQSFLETIAQAILSKCDRKIIELKEMQSVLADLLREEEVFGDDPMSIDPRQFIRLNCSDISFDSSSRMLQDRYYHIKERFLRQRETNPLNNFVESIVSVKRNHSSNETVCLLGMLSFAEEDAFGRLEDPEDFLLLDFSKISYIQPRYYGSGRIILVEGCMIDSQVFSVSSLQMVPAEAPPNSQADSTAFTEYKRCVTAGSCPEPSLLICSRFDMTQQKNANECISKISSILESSNLTPTALLLIGPFATFNTDQPDECLEKYQDGFTRLAKMLEKHPRFVASSHLILVPAPEDAFYPSKITPTPPIPEVVILNLQRIIPDLFVHLSSDPCRLSFGSIDIVVYAHNGLSQVFSQQLRQTKLSVMPKPVESCLAETILDQGHLAPICNQSRLVIDWRRESTLRLTSTPHAVK